MDNLEAQIEAGRQLEREGTEQEVIERYGRAIHYYTGNLTSIH